MLRLHLLTRVHLVTLLFVISTAAAAQNSEGATGTSGTLAVPAYPTIMVLPVRMEANASRLKNVGVFSMGMGLHEKELDDFTAALRASLNTLKHPKSDSTKNWKIHTIIRAFQVATDNSSGYALACVAWCVDDGESTPLFHEQFYASAGGTAFAGLGAEGKARKAIIERITKTVGVLSALDDTRQFRPPVVNRTFGTFEEAAKRLPSEMASYMPGHAFGSQGSKWVLVTGGTNIRGSAEWSWVSREDSVDWRAILTSQTPGQ